MKEEVCYSQTSLADGGISGEEKLRQVKKVEMQKKYRFLSVLLVGVIISAIFTYLFVTQKCFFMGHKWQAATCTDPKTCAICAAVDGDALGHAPMIATQTLRAILLTMM